MQFSVLRVFCTVVLFGVTGCSLNDPKPQVISMPSVTDVEIPSDRTFLITDTFDVPVSVGTSGFSCQELKLQIRWCLSSVRMNSKDAEELSWLRAKLGGILAHNRSLLNDKVAIVWPPYCTDLQDRLAEYKICRSQTSLALPLNPYNFLENIDEF